LSVIDKFVYIRKLNAVLSYLDYGPTLDCGCGDMRYTNRIPNSIGIDPNPEFEGNINAPDYIMSATELTFPDKTFVNILFLDTLEHIDEYYKALKQAHRVLTDGGTLIISDPNDMMLFVLRVLVLRFRDALRGNPDHKHEFSRGDIFTASELAGFEFIDKKELFFCTVYKFKKVS